LEHVNLSDNGLSINLSYSYISIFEQQVPLSRTSMNLKLLAFLLSVGSLGGANSIGFTPDDQVPLTQTEMMSPPDSGLNLLRLVQLEGKDPVWMTELEKVGFSLWSSAILIINSLAGYSDTIEGSRPQVF
jgi:hypothetical protein